MIYIAVVKIWKVVTHLDQVVDYAEDHNKTDLSNFKDLNDLMYYAMNGDKTEESLYMSGINCDPNNATKEMIMIKDKYLKIYSSIKTETRRKINSSIKDSLNENVNLLFCKIATTIFEKEINIKGRKTKSLRDAFFLYVSLKSGFI